jgi:hypothetical protein
MGELVTTEVEGAALEIYKRFSDLACLVPLWKFAIWSAMMKLILVQLCCF